MRTLLRGFGCAAALAFLVGPSVGLAETVTGTTDGKFTNPTPSHSPIVTTGVGTSHFTWGKPANIAGTDEESAPNSLDWAPASAVSTELEEDFLLGTLTYFNGTVAGNSVPDFVDLSINIALGGSLDVSQTFNFTLGLYSTPNTGTDDENADYVYFPSVIPDQTFTIDGTLYTLAITGFRGFDGDKVITANDKGFHVLEQGTASASLYGRLTADFGPPPAVPEPASIVSAATAGLVGLGLLARRRRKETTV